MATYKSFEQLDIWKKARVFANHIHSQTVEGGFSRDFALKDQINKSGGSIMDNIAEGFERGGTKEFVMFLSYAKGSAGEARSQLYRAYDRSYLDDAAFNSLRDEALEISRGISGFIAYLKGSPIKGLKYRQINEDSTLDTNGSLP